MNISSKNFLITGGTGSFGTTLCKYLLKKSSLEYDTVGIKSIKNNGSGVRMVYSFSFYFFLEIKWAISYGSMAVAGA